MGMEEIQKICEYIRKNNPQAEDFATIAAAVTAVTGGKYRAVTKKEINGADGWLVPEGERGQFAGVSDGPGLYEQFSPAIVQMILDAVADAKKSQSFIADNAKLADIDLPKITPIEASPVVHSSGEDARSFIVNNHEFAHIDLPKLEKTGADLVADDKLKDATKMPEYNDIQKTDPEIAKAAGKVVSISYSSEPTQTLPVIINDYASNRLRDASNVNNNSELKAMMEEPTMNKDVPTDEFGDIHDNIEKPDNGFNK